jgi:AI-2 transport protein TqsA
MSDRFQTFVLGAILALIAGWVLHVGKEIFVPIVFSILVVYVIVGLTRLLGSIPFLGELLPPWARQTLSVLIIALGLVEGVYLIVSNRNSLMALAPQYQESLLAAIQRVAVYLRIESEPTWASLRQDLFAQVSMQRLIGSTVASLSSIVVSVVVVVLYASFLLLEHGSFARKIANLSSNPRYAARIREVTTDINTRIGSYLALKTFVSILLGAISYLVMEFLDLQFAAFWAVLIALLNYVPYIGSFLGVLLPVAMSVVQFGSVHEIVAILLSLTVVQFAIGNVLDPYLMSNSLNLSPFAILVSLTVWTALWGVPGAFLAVPITAILAIVFSQFAGTRPIAVLLSRSGKL